MGPLFQFTRYEAPGRVKCYRSAFDGPAQKVTLIWNSFSNNAGPLKKKMGLIELGLTHVKPWATKYFILFVYWTCATK